MEYAVKFVQGHDDLIEGMLAPFGGTDLMGEHFTPETDFELDWFGDFERPLLYAHGTDDAIKTSVIGRMKVEQTDKGIWMQAQLDKNHAYKDAVSDLIGQGALGLSAGSIERFYFAGRDTKTGAIKHFPLIEGSLTPQPAHPEALLAPYAAKSLDAEEHLAVLGVTVPDAIKEAPEATEEPTAELVELTVEPATEDHIWDAIKSVLSPQSLHDAAVSSGAVCAESEAPEPSQPVLAVGAAKQAFDLDAYRAEVAAAVNEAVQSYLKP